MKITRQVALVAVPPLATTAAAGAFAATAGAGNLLTSAATAALMGLAAAASFVAAQPVVKRVSQSGESEAQSLEGAFKSSGFDNTSVALMTVDRDLVVTNVNDATKKLLSDNADTFRKVWPSFNANQIVGTCIDMFHKNPSHQRQILSDPSRLPYKTEIKIDEFRFALHVNAVFDAKGEYVGNVLEWDDVTEDRMKSSMLDALDRSQATIEFTLDGKIVNANENFLSAMGYSIDQIRGKHHSMFVGKDYAASADYQRFWDEIRQGKYQSGEFKRIGAGGNVIWIQASYNPVLDGNGQPFKVVKFASDITEEVNARHRREREQKEKAAAQELVVTSLASGLRELSEGNLVHHLDQPFAEEYEELRQNFNLAVSKLHNVMSMIANTANGVRHGSTEISNAADDLSKRTENQAATLEETAAALDEITATVKQSAENATEAHSVAASAQKAANESGEVVTQTVSAMGEIEKSSKQISQIIGVIDDIAFQTNLLALNAGVEAARAGDAGRGFAVVAQEVRALAQRSSDAAKEIKALITTSSQHVENGADLVGRAGKALQEIVERVGSINDLISNIAASSKEQADSLAEANSAVNNMDQVTQQNAAMVEETTAACHSLTKDAAELITQVSHFRTSGSQSGGSQAPAQQGGPTVVDQQRRAAAFLAGTNGSAALKVEPEDVQDDWEDF